MTLNSTRMDDARAARDVQILKGLALGMAFGLSATGSAVVGAATGAVLLGYAARRSASTPEQQWRFILANLGWVVGAAVLGFLGHGTFANWPDFKQGFVDGWNAF